MQHRLWRVFGTLAIANIAILFAALSVEGFTSELGSSNKDLTKSLVHGSLVSRYAGGYAEVMSTFVFLFAALLLARLLRGTSEWTGWLASMISATAVVNFASALIVGFPAGAAAIYDGHHGASLETVRMANDIRNFAYFLSVADLGVFTACVGGAILATRALPRWLGWSGLAAGVLCVVAVAGARNGAHNLANLAQMAWWVVLGIAALRARVSTPKRAGGRVSATV